SPNARHTMSTPMSRKLLIAIQASVTKPSFSNHGVLHGTVAEHELLSSNAGTRSTSQWYRESGAPSTTNTSAVVHTARARRSTATPSTMTSGYIRMRWYQHSSHGVNPACSE